MKDKMAIPLFAVLALCVDACAVMFIGTVQLSSSLINNTFITLWTGGLMRSFLLLLLIYTYSGSPAWMRGFDGVLTAAGHGLLYPVYLTFLWACGRPTVELVWGWHTWQGLLQGYAVLALSLLLWKRYVPTLLPSTEKRKTEQKGKASLQRLLGYMKPFTGRFAVVFFFVVISSLGEMAIPHYTGKMTDWIMNEDEPEAFNHAITVMTLMTIMSAVCEFVCDLIYNVTMSRIHTSIQGLVFQSVLKQDIGFFDKASTGDIVSRITTDTNTMSETLSEKLSLLMWYFMRVIFLFGSMMLLSVKLSIFTALGLPVIWIIPEFSGKFYQKLSVKVQESLAKANDVAMETFSSMKTVRSFANEDGETERYRKCLDDTYALNKVEAAAYAASTWTNSMSSLALKVSILYYGGRLVTGSDVSSGDLVSFVLYELQFSSAVEVLMSYWPQVKKAVGASEKIFEYVERKPDTPPDGSYAPQALKGHVHFKNMTFAYPKRPDTNVLKDVSLELKPGQISALVGPSGSGKTTIVSLLERFYQPQKGEILLDEKPLLCYKDEYLHEKISVVSQEPVLFARSVRENIKYGKENATDEEMYAAAKLANADEFISNLPKGYDTDAGEKGGQVSGGQKQRIAIARALIRQPQILVLDDATSSLDTESEHKVYSTLRKDLKNCTVLLITHRLSGVENADHIVFLKDGKVAEQGNHEQLLARNEFYAEFVKQQNTSISRNTEDSTDVGH
ncbi:antigen peptide transporter 1 [Triplophysa rosa]|uniref:Antigen peptide transporter 1 n=1 Tax=Triplophysa rosa TaxID=992332 RepID=A0A9W7WQR9_TRIRA|nr:antigen peptide transporter 1 [Triplophysa rosa]KAI7806642.1 putative antigen peptide transporter 1 [Triplophysa rosa]